MRIITGKAKGLKLKTPTGIATRPTSDRVKESLFSILGGLVDFAQISVLDIFAGTGALGLESISRGANSATFIDAATASIIAENSQRAKFLNCKILRDDFKKALKKLASKNLQFDLIFSDPPYQKNLAQISVNLVSQLNLLKNSGLLIVEHGINENLDAPKNLHRVRKITYGHTTAIDIFQKKEQFMRKALCTGSFDPVTNGHVNIFERAAKLVDELVVCVFVNNKKKALFTPQERVDLLRESTLHIDNLTVDSYDGLVADYLKENDINLIIRGLRSSGDFEYEYNQAQMVKHLAPNVTTIFLLTAPEFLFISSSAIRELAQFHGDVHKLVPECVELALREKQKTAE